MIVGLGIDVVEVARIRRILAGPVEIARRFLARCFTDEEPRYCDSFRDRAARYAARFAAKEAASKALATPAGISWQDVEVARGEGPPALVLHGVAAEAAARLGATRRHLTLTHDGGVAAATVVLEATGSGGEPPPQPGSAGRTSSGGEPPPQPGSAGRTSSGGKP